MAINVRLWGAKRSVKGRPSHSGPLNLLALGALPNDVIRTELIIYIIHTLGRGFHRGK